MNTKNRLIKKLLGAAKKHKVLTYPVLALVAVISVISYFFSWSTGAGKRVVAVIMVMVMLISQSYFLTSSANDLVDTEESELVQQELQEAGNESDSKTSVDSDTKTDSSEKSFLVDISEPVSSEPADTVSADSSETDSTINDDVINDSDNAVQQTESIETQNTSESSISEDSASDINSDSDVENGDVSTDSANGDDIDSDEIKEDIIDTKNDEETVHIPIRYHYASDTLSDIIMDSSADYGYVEYIDGQTEYDISDKMTAALNELNTSRTEGGCYKFTGWYLDSGCTNEASGTFTLTSGSTINLYSERSIVYYRVNLDTNSGGDLVSYTVDGLNSTVFAVDGESNTYLVSADTAKMTLSDVYRKGYDAEIPTVSGGGSGSAEVGEDTSSVTASFVSSSDGKRNVTLNWTGKMYNIEYTDYYGNVVETQEVQYGKTKYTFFNGSEKSKYPDPGWLFDSWHIGSADGDLVESINDSVASYQDKLYDESGTVKLYPSYKYDGYTLAYDNFDAGVHNDGGGDNLYYQYKKRSSSGSIKGKYTSNDRPGSTHFTYKITSLSTKSTLENDYNIYLQDGSNGIIVSTGSTGNDVPKKTTGTDGIPVTFTITDSSVTDADVSAGVKKEEEFTVYIHVSPKVLRIVEPDEEETTKTYDGTVKTFLGTNELETDDDGGSTITFSTSEYNSPEVSKADTIILHGVVINPPAGESATNYVLYGTNEDDSSEAYISGSIEKRPMYVKTFAVLSDVDEAFGAVRTGEADPELDFEEDTSSSYKNKTMGLLAKDEKLLKELPLAVPYVEPSREGNYEKISTYTIKVNSNPDSNYEVYVSVAGTFDVKQQSPEGLYEYNDGLEESAWHVGSDVAIVAKKESGYDTVRISRDGGTNYTDGGAITEADSKNDNLRLKLYDSTTGAVTSDIHITVKCDTTAPKYAGYSVDEVPYESGNTTGLYFPGVGSVLDFGTYINSAMTIRIKYTDDTSELAFLHYGLFNESADARVVPFDKTTKTATISILRSAIENADTKKGIITCYAEDVAGLKSGETILSPNGNNKGYEFSVEKGAPEVGKLIVYAGKSKSTIVADQAGLAEDKMQFYNNCQASVTVSDAVSGLESIVWHINSEDTAVELHQKTKIDQPTTYTKDIVGANSKVITVYATVYDNAGNETDTNSVTFRLDDVPPNLDVDYDDELWRKDTTISFTTSDDLSGVDYAKVTDSEGNTIDCDLGKPDADGVYSASFKADTKGVYSIVVADKAGNTMEWTKDVQRISTAVPDCPVITVTPAEPNGENGWFNADGSAVSALITYSTVTGDKTPTIAGYRLWKEGETGYNDTPIENGKITVPIDDEGVFKLKAWVDSVSGVHCADYDDHIETIKIDRTAPDISFSTEKGTGSTIIVHFDITDPISGVNGESIQVLHGDKNIDITISSIEDGFSGSFEIAETGNYTIKAKDNAGNESDEAAFTPMSMKIKAVSNITDTSATVGANIIKGTFDVKSAVISYRKYSDKDFKEADTVVNYEDGGNAAASAVLTDLTPATSYVFKVTATSDANEVLEYEGYFRTLSSDQSGISVIGTARYSDNSTGDITVGLFDGNECMMAQEIAAGNEFAFFNVPDGNYSIVATDGTYSKTARLLIEDGMIVYPTSYIELVLSGKNTSVVITTSDTPKVTADNMDSIFNDDTVNFTSQDTALIDNGGTVEFKLYATLMTLSSVSSDEISAMYAVTDSSKIVGAYLDLSLYKIVTDVNGDVERSRVTNLANPASISVTIPLGDLAGKKGLEVVRIHNDGENFLGASLADEDSNPSTYTISTNQFSTYAVLYSPEGSSAATTTEKTPASTATTEKRQVNPASTSTNVQQNPTSTTVDNEVTTEKKTTEDKEDIREIEENTRKAKASKASSVGTLTSAGSAKTGDSSPIAVLILIMLVSLGGVTVLLRKVKKMN